MIHSLVPCENFCEQGLCVIHTAEGMIDELVMILQKIEAKLAAGS